MVHHSPPLEALEPARRLPDGVRNTAVFAAVSGAARHMAAPGDMLASALHRLRTGEGIQLRLFRTITRQLWYARQEEMLINIWGNILLFIPYGFFLPLLWKRYRHPLQLSLMCLLLPLSIETCQLFIRRMTDVDDLLLNFAGGMLGGGVFALVHMVFPKFTDKALVRG